MNTPPIVYATFVGPINQDTVSRIIGSTAGAILQGATEAHLLFQSNGGVVGDGIALHNFFKTLTIPLHIYNCGTVASVAVIAYLGALHRYVSAYGNFMIHKSAVLHQDRMTAAKMFADGQALVAEDIRTDAMLKAYTTIPQSRLPSNQAENSVFNASEAIQFGIANAQREFQVPAGNQIFNI